MAIENQVILNGQIQKMRKLTNDKITSQISIGLLVARKPQFKYIEGRNFKLRTDVVSVIIRDADMIKYIENKRTIEGDMLEVCGVYCTLHANKIFHCSSCGQENVYQGASTFVSPLCVRVSEIHPKQTEIVQISEIERNLRSQEEIMELLNERKSLPGQILSVEELDKKPSKGYYNIRLTIREEILENELDHWFKKMSVISNKAYVIGNLCADPVYNPIENGGRVCTYQVGINRKVYIKEDDPSIRADFPWIKSLGEQAEKDRDSLVQGSLVFIEGSIQARSGFKMKKICEHCGEENLVEGKTMEIVPYYVEYLRNVNQIDEEKEAELEGDSEDSFEEELTALPQQDEEPQSDQSAETKKNKPSVERLSNQIILNGKIDKIRKIKAVDGHIQYQIAMIVIKRPKSITGNRKAQVYPSTVHVIVNDEKMVEYLNKSMAASGDFLEVFGFYKMIPVKKEETCRICGHLNVFHQKMAIVEPIYLRVDELHPKSVETVLLTKSERNAGKEKILEILNKRQKSPGTILALKEVGVNESGHHVIRMITRVPITDKETITYLQWMGEISNRAYVMGAVTEDPVPEIDEYDKTPYCSYPVQSLYNYEDEDKELSIPIMSQGAQALDDKEIIKKNSYVFIDGFIKANEYKTEHLCENCLEPVSTDNELSPISPYSVEYLRDCEIRKEEDEDDIGIDLTMEDYGHIPDIDDESTQFDEIDEDGVSEDFLAQFYESAGELHEDEEGSGANPNNKEG